VEAEYSVKLQEIEARHKLELSAIAPEGCDNDNSVSPRNTPEEDIAMVERQKKLEQIRLKREMERQKEIERQRALEEETSNAGPSPRDIEMDQILEQLRPLHFEIASVPADGNCLYRAVAAQYSSDATYQEIRKCRCE